jgi:xanthine dehydrogenase accessory factor
MTDHTPGTEDTGSDDAETNAVSTERVDRLAAEHRAAGRPFASVTVVRREPPVSAEVGDRALVTPDGDLTGWIGGTACAQSVAVEEAIAALNRGEPTLVGLAPDPNDVDRPGLSAYPMTCHSGGVLELFVEPVTPAPRLVVVGETPVARALVRFAAETRYDVTTVVGSGSDADGGDGVTTVDGADAVVVASMGANDRAGLEAAISAGVPYIGLVASGTRWDELAGDVAASLDADVGAVTEAVSCPAGLDIGAKTAEEIAVSVLAELVSVRRRSNGVSLGGVAVDASTVGVADTDGDADGDATADATADAIDPVCGMAVPADEAAATVTHDGEVYHFCGQGCADAFEGDPEQYAEVVTGG